MNARDTASLALRLIGVFVLTRTLGYLPWAFATTKALTSTGPGNEDTVGLLFCLLAPLLHIAAALIIICKSDTIAHRVVPDERIMIASGLNADTVRTLAFCVVGLVLLTGAIPKLGQFAYSYAVFRHNHHAQKPYSLYGRLIGAALQLAIGTWLFLQAEGLAGLWKRLRETKQPQNCNCGD